MPARPLILDDIELELKSALAKDIVIPTCCVVTCKKKADVLFSLRWLGAKTNVYALCAGHMAEIKAQHPNSLGEPQKQGVFLY